MTFSSYFKNIRLKNNESQVNMAKILNISVTSVKFIENGTTKFPSEKLLQKICEYTIENPTEVMEQILFTAEDIKSHPLSCSYLTNMYLEDWNIKDSPYIVHSSNNKNFTFNARIIKKRENKNIFIISQCDNFFTKQSLEYILKNKDINSFMVNIVSSTLYIDEPFRGLHILFDSNNNKQVELFNLCEENMFYQFSYTIEFKLFDSNNHKLIDSKKITRRRTNEH